MYWDVVELKLVAPRTLEVLFADGLRGTIFIDVSFCTGVFEVLKNNEVIGQAFIANGAVTWENELDLAPDTMHKEIKNNPNRLYILRR
jgi:curli biogenesis system outer membrane secretion channel CsgG